MTLHLATRTELAEAGFKALQEICATRQILILWLNVGDLEMNLNLHNLFTLISSLLNLIVKICASGKC